jgi:hypothetical protein
MPITTWVTAKLFVPFFNGLRLTSAYEYVMLPCPGLMVSWQTYTGQSETTACTQVSGAAF